MEESRATVYVEQKDQEIAVMCPFTLPAYLYLTLNKVKVEVEETGDAVPFVDWDGDHFTECMDYSDLEAVDVNAPLMKLMVRNFHPNIEIEKSVDLIVDILSLRRGVCHEFYRIYDSSRFIEGKDEWVEEAVASMQNLSEALGTSHWFINIGDVTTRSPLDIIFLGIGSIVLKKLENSRLHKKLFMCTNLLGIVEKFFHRHVKNYPSPIDFSEQLHKPFGGLNSFMDFLKNSPESQRISHSVSSDVYVCNFTSGNPQNLPEGVHATKVFRPPTDWKYNTEVVYCRMLRSDKVAECIGYAEDKKEKCIVYRYYENGDLLTRIQEATDLGEILDILIQVGYILHLVHSEYIVDPPVYHDFKPQNFLRDGNKIVICDLAAARPEGQESETHSEPYIDDFCPLGAVAFQGSDMYKYGKLIVEMTTTQPLRTEVAPGDFVTVPFIGEVVAERRNGELEDLIRPELHEKMEDAVELVDIALSCFNENQRARPSACQVVDQLHIIEDRYKASQMQG